jgi:hypothetical protein
MIILYIVDVKNFKNKQDNKYDNNLNISNRIIINPPRKTGSNINSEDDNINTGNIIENKDIAFNYQKKA